jgi:hypothetical protein
MKLSKKEALELYVLLTTHVPSTITLSTLNDRLKDFLLEESIVESRPCQGSCHEGEEDDSIVEDVEVDSQDPDVDDDELEVPTVDGTVDPEDLHALVAVAATIPDGSRSKIEFEELDAGPVDLVVEGTGEIIKNVSHVTRSAGELSVFNDDGWTTFIVKKFPKGWTSLLEVGMTYLVER